MVEALALAEVVKEADELSDSDLFALLEPGVELWGDAGARVPHRTDLRVQGLLLPPVSVVPSNLLLGNAVVVLVSN